MSLLCGHCSPTCSGLGMPSTLLEKASERLPRRYAKHANDVFVLVKAYVSDNELCQEPLLILPGQLHAEIANAFTTMANTNAPCILIWMSLSPSPSLLIKPWTHHYRLFATWGMDTSLSDERRQDLKDLAQYLLDFFSPVSTGSALLATVVWRIGCQTTTLDKTWIYSCWACTTFAKGTTKLNRSWTLQCAKAASQVSPILLTISWCKKKIHEWVCLQSTFKCRSVIFWFYQLLLWSTFLGSNIGIRCRTGVDSLNFGFPLFCSWSLIQLWRRTDGISIEWHSKYIFKINNIKWTKPVSPGGEDPFACKGVWRREWWWNLNPTKVALGHGWGWYPPKKKYTLMSLSRTIKNVTVSLTEVQSSFNQQDRMISGDAERELGQLDSFPVQCRWDHQTSLCKGAAGLCKLQLQ